MSTVSIEKTFTTETSHKLWKSSTSKRCSKSFHGHSYKWIVQIKGELDEKDFVIDFGDLKQTIGKTIDEFDHCMVLCEKEKPEIINFFKKNTERLIIMKRNPTAEAMARYIHKQAEELMRARFFTRCCTKVTVYETATGCAFSEDSDKDDIVTYKQGV